MRGADQKPMMVVHRSAMKRLGAQAAVGLGLTARDAYGVTSYLLAQRQGEIGIRLAVGARSFEVGKLIVKFGLGLAGAGLVFGLAAGVAGAWVLRHAVYGVS